MTTEGGAETEEGYCFWGLILTSGRWTAVGRSVQVKFHALIELNDRSASSLTEAFLTSGWRAPRLCLPAWLHLRMRSRFAHPLRAPALRPRRRRSIKSTAESAIQRARCGSCAAR